MRVDLCCGDKKRTGSLGVDHAPGPGIDIVHDLDIAPWPLKDNSSEDILCEHGFEHVKDTVSFIQECHRILKPEGRLKIVVPHFSSSNSYGNTTHLRQLSAYWYEPFVSGYLATSGFKWELESSRVTFGRSFGSLIGKVLVMLLGQRKWERSWAFIFQANDIHTVLIAKKD
jgi:SAM-dependent methyltransferase